MKLRWTERGISSLKIQLPARGKDLYHETYECHDPEMKELYAGQTPASAATDTDNKHLYKQPDGELQAA